MKRLPEYLLVAGIALPLTLVTACAQISSAVSTASADAPEVASALETICNNLVPAAEATANMLAKGGAAATIQSAETNYVTPACAAAKTAATAVDSGWLANVVASLVTTAANGASGTATQNGGN